MDHQVGVACMDILPEPCKRDITDSWGNDTTETAATEPSHAASGNEPVEELETLRHLQVAGQLEGKWAMPSGRFGHRDTPGVEVMRAKVNIGLGLDFENEIIFSCRAFFRRSIQNKTAATYVCRRSKTCEINLRTRKNCQYCR